MIADRDVGKEAVRIWGADDLVKGAKLDTWTGWGRSKDIRPSERYWRAI